MTGLAGLHIALVGPVPPPAGGMAMQTRQLAELLTLQRARVTLVAMRVAMILATLVVAIPLATNAA